MSLTIALSLIRKSIAHTTDRSRCLFFARAPAKPLTRPAILERKRKKLELNSRSLKMRIKERTNDEEMGFKTRHSRTQKKPQPLQQQQQQIKNEIEFNENNKQCKRTKED